MTNKQKYIALIKENKVNLFIQDWWLDIVCNEDWDVFLYEQEGKILAAFPYNIHKTTGFKTIVPAVLTPISGMFIDYSFCNKLSEQYSLENKSTEAFAEFLNKEKLAYFHYHLSPKNFFWLGFYWKGFSSTVHYTYKVNVENIEECFHSFLPVMRKNIRRAERKFHIETSDFDLKDIYDNILCSTYKKQKIQTPYSFPVFKQIVEESYKRNQGLLLVAKDSEEKTMGVLFIAWDNETCYNLISGFTNSNEQNYAMSLLTWQAMKHTNALGLKDFDMEGSMIKNIEHYFRFFSGKRTPYLIIEKRYSKIFFLLKRIKKLLK
ncbi:MAG: GNAT family N-acetyltransferase [Bacteroidales bacterium]|nr:GNAT family N-acetyltransferase [Bacteroidales bacterium]